MASWQEGARPSPAVAQPSHLEGVQRVLHLQQASRCSTRWELRQTYLSAIGHVLAECMSGM